MTEAAATFPHTCTIRRYTLTTNDAGQKVETGSPSDTTGVACNYQPSGTRERSGRMTTVLERSRLYLPDGTDVKLDDKIVSISTAPSGLIYRVVDRSIWDGSHIECDLERFSAHGE